MSEIEHYGIRRKTRSQILERNATYRTTGKESSLLQLFRRIDLLGIAMLTAVKCKRKIGGCPGAIAYLFVALRNGRCGKMEQAHVPSVAANAIVANVNIVVGIGR